jgi:hypothetical protein
LCISRVVGFLALDAQTLRVGDKREPRLRAAEARPRAGHRRGSLRDGCAPWIAAVDIDRTVGRDLGVGQPELLSLVDERRAAEGVEHQRRRPRTCRPLTASSPRPVRGRPSRTTSDPPRTPSRACSTTRGHPKPRVRSAGPSRRPLVRRRCRPCTSGFHAGARCRSTWPDRRSLHACRARAHRGAPATSAGRATRRARSLRSCAAVPGRPATEAP